MKTQRISKRLKPCDLAINIYTGFSYVNGDIEDISFEGIKVTNLSNRLFFENCRIISIISSNNEFFKFEICPIWIYKKFPGSYQEVGFEILKPPETWISFIQAMLPVREIKELC